MNLKSLVYITISFILFACGTETKKETKNTKPKIEVRNSKGLKIAYYNNDSIKEKFEYYKREDAAVTKKQKAFQTELEKRTREYEKFVQRKDQEARTGLLSENEIMLAQQKAQQMQALIMQYQQTQGAKIEEETVKKLEAINKKIEALGKKYCELHGIDLLLIHGEGGQLNYIHPSMDVTTEFINYLNENQDQIEKELN
jgi:Skp family chaperone for outer membrane proteins